MQVKRLDLSSELWITMADYADNCTWSAGKNLAKRMREHGFSDYESVFAAIENNSIAGYCTLTKTDCIPGVTYTPYIGFVFVGEQYRGKRTSEKLILSAMEYAKEVGFDKVYLVSDHVNLYEKYGFVKVDEQMAPWGSVQIIFERPV